MLAWEEGEQLRRGLESLSLKVRTCLVLYYYNGASIQEIAKATGTLPGTVKSRLHRGKCALYGLLSQNQEKSTKIGQEVRP